ncbi:NADPH:adrenodoxin oxidoreductase, mitochondrial [Strongyloides ratti]|uniref:NADPH:adrenodoxin oxidoreductase, mitochondrial n=1 Tax=Strongyloides ratti TaxID=34506 RepID=A0A090KU81_STRRB|nr:NADPH:adrenodoxin oxidoreductase, mitochondrial [Strongyloides ratti]CEF61065.1 NADPH:adrenodoxin oxidoreductase, mitochondrial [Strongyloides ratti]
MDVNSYDVYRRETPKESILESKVIYINGKSNLMYLIDKCIKALERTSDSVIFFALGAQINKGCLVLGELQQRYGFTLDFDIFTKTEIMVDDLVPYLDDEDIKTRERFKSSMIFPPRIAIVGAGPSGLYTSTGIIRKFKNAYIDIFDKSPVPYGLVRYGVAPDHQDVKNCIHQFEKLFINNSNNVSLFCNVNIGHDVTYKELCQNYDAIILAYGASKNRHLSIPGIDAINCFAGGDFVSWYNGAPNFNAPLLDKKYAVIIGNGNVSLDCARILLKNVKNLTKYDITNKELHLLEESRVSDIKLYGRRGPENTSVTIKEFREFLRLPCASIKIDMSLEYFNNLNIDKYPRPLKRILELMINHILEQEKNVDGEKNGVIGFYKSPVKVHKNSSNRIEALDIKNNLTNEIKTIPCDLLIYAIGFETYILNGLPQISNKLAMKDFYRVDNSNIDTDCLTYATGWCIHGAKGVIASTQADAFGVAGELYNDLCNNKFGEKKGIKTLLNNRKIRYINWDDWKKIDEKEIELGKVYGKEREKLQNVLEVLGK